MATIPEEYQDLFERETFAHFATVLPDGTPQITPVWIDHDAGTGRVVVNTERGRRKERNVRENPKVGLSAVDPDDPYRFISIRGVVEAVTEEGADEHIDALAKRYMGVEEYPAEGETGARVRIEIRPESVTTSEEG